MVRILRQRSTKGSWKKMQKFEITVSKTAIVFLDILSKEPMTNAFVRHC